MRRFCGWLSGCALVVGLAALLHAQPITLGFSSTINTGHPLFRGLMAWYPTFSHLAGGLRWYDMAGSNHGTLTNGPVWGADSSGRFEAAVQFLPTDDQVLIPDAPPLDFGTGPFTVCFSLFVAETALTVNTEYLVLGKTTVYQTAPGWFFELSTYNGGTTTSYHLVFAATGGTDWTNHNIEAGLVAVRQWVPVCGVRSGSTGTLYASGIAIGTQTTADWALSVDNAVSLVLGPDPTRVDAVTFVGFSMHLTNLLLYNRALSASEIQLLSTCSAPTYCGMVQEPDLPVVGQAGVRRRVINQ
jgi:Concanavalin A-like lectin/glucanases superfamily